MVDLDFVSELRNVNEKFRWVVGTNLEIMKLNFEVTADASRRIDESKLEK